MGLDAIEKEALRMFRRFCVVLALVYAAISLGVFFACVRRGDAWDVALTCLPLAFMGLAGIVDNLFV